MPRAVKKGPALSERVVTYVGLPAGSKFANRLLKVVLYPVLDLVLAFGKGQIDLTKFVDDLAVRLIGTLRQLQKSAPAIVLTTIRLLEGLLQLKVSRGSKGKSKFVASSDELVDAVGQQLEDAGIKHSRSERWLGVACGLLPLRLKTWHSIATSLTMV